MQYFVWLLTIYVLTVLTILYSNRGSSKVYVLLYFIWKTVSESVSYSVKRSINFTGTFSLSVNRGVIWSFLTWYVHLSSSQVFQVCHNISEVGSKQVGTKLPNDLIMILINRSAVVRSAVNLLPKVEGKQYQVRQWLWSQYDDRSAVDRSAEHIFETMKKWQAWRRQWLPITCNRRDKQVGSRQVGTGFNSYIVVGSRQVDGTHIRNDK